MTKDQILYINLVNSVEEPIALAGVVLTVSFFLNGNYRFAFRSKPSNSKGLILIEYDYLEENRLRNLKAQPLDYKTTLDECDSFIRITLPPKEELISAADVLERMGGIEYSETADSWRNSLNKSLSAKEREITLSKNMNRCNLICLPRGNSRGQSKGASKRGLII